MVQSIAQILNDFIFTSSGFYLFESLGVFEVHCVTFENSVHWGAF